MACLQHNHVRVRSRSVWVVVRMERRVVGTNGIGYKLRTELKKEMVNTPICSKRWTAANISLPNTQGSETTQALDDGLDGVEFRLI